MKKERTYSDTSHLLGRIFLAAAIVIIVLMIVDLKLISYTIVSIIIFPIIYQNILQDNYISEYEKLELIEVKEASSGSTVR